jgi:hypothetical protein
VNEFQQAADSARSQIGADRWAALSTSEQASAIYEELRRLDAERAARSPGRSDSAPNQ